MELHVKGLEYTCNHLRVDYNTGVIDVLDQNKKVLSQVTFDSETQEIDYSDFRGADSKGIVRVKRKG